MTFLRPIFALSDEQAMWRVQMHDDAEAFAHLLKRWEQPIKRLCLRMLGDSHKADDIAQEAFARIYTRRSDYHQTAKFSTFLWRVAVNLCLDEMRRIKRRRELSLEQGRGDRSEPEQPWAEPASVAPTPAASLVAAEEAALVRDALGQLPEHYRCVVVLRHFENLKFREIAEVLNLPEGTVKSRMAEALTLLNQILKRRLNPSARHHDVLSHPASPETMAAPVRNARSPRTQHKESFAL